MERPKKRIGNGDEALELIKVWQGAQGATWKQPRRFPVNQPRERCPTARKTLEERKEFGLGYHARKIVHHRPRAKTSPLKLGRNEVVTWSGTLLQPAAPSSYLRVPVQPSPVIVADFQTTATRSNYLVIRENSSRTTKLPSAPGQYLGFLASGGPRASSG